MTIKEKLEQLDYSDVFDLYSLWILQNAEPPDKWLIIHELSDLANMDADAAKELSDEIDKLLADEDEETSDNILTGDKAKEVLTAILSDATGSPYIGPYVSGYYPDETNEGKKGFTTFDNTTKECWTEFFLSEQDAIAFCKGEIEAAETTSDNKICPQCDKEFPSGKICVSCGFTGEGIKKESPIIVSIKGGCVVDVQHVPSDKYVEIHDYDIEGSDETPDNIDDDGDGYFLSIY